LYGNLRHTILGDSLSLLFCILFTREILNTKRLAPKVDISLLMVACVCLLVGGLSLFVVDRLVLMNVLPFLPIAISVPVLAVLIPGMINMFRDNFKYVINTDLVNADVPVVETRVGLYYILAWGPLLIGISLSSARGYGLLESNVFTAYFLKVAIVFEALLFSMSLAEKIKIVHNERKQATIAMRLAEEAARVRTEFLTSISHDLRDPMHRIISLSSFAQAENDAIEKERLLHKVQANATHLDSIVNDLLDHSKLLAGKLTLNSKAFELDEVCENLRSCLSTSNDGVELTFKNSVPPGVYRGDPARIFDVLMNLLWNSIKFTYAGKIALYVHCEERNEDRHTIVFEVNDTGIGIPNENIDSLFQPFQQADNVQQGKRKGSGLGLSICHELIQLMGGEIRVESIVGVGTKISVLVPLQSISESDNGSDSNWFVSASSGIERRSPVLDSVHLFPIRRIDCTE
jgi:signal transduction histidine kinase